MSRGTAVAIEGALFASWFVMYGVAFAAVA